MEMADKLESTYDITSKLKDEDLYIYKVHTQAEQTKYGAINKGNFIFNL